jgi:CelD/BcsL family acetyltransferase involved in cellulose biosynthesis
MKVEIIDDIQRFAELRLEWNELLAASRADCPFLTWEWLYTWWTHLRGSRRLQLITVRDGDELIALAPLAVSRAPVPWLSTLEFLGTGYAGSDYLDVIARRDRETEGVHSIAETLASQKRAVHLDHLPPSSLASGLVEPLIEGRWTLRETMAGACPFVRLADQSWDSYLGMLGPAHRANVRRRLRAIERQFEVRVERAASEKERRAFLSTLMALHNRRWSTRGGSTAFPTDALRSFHDEVTRCALERGWLRLFVLRLDSAPAAAMYCFAYGGKYYFYQGAFDERFQQFSVGLVMLALTIRAAIEEGSLEFDLLYGTEAYKALWARNQRLLSRIDLFPAHIGGRIHQRTVEANRAMRALARRILSRRSACTTSVTSAGAVS